MFICRDFLTLFYKQTVPLLSWVNSFSFLDESGLVLNFIFIHFFYEFRIAPDGMPHSAVLHPGLYCCPINRTPGLK